MRSATDSLSELRRLIDVHARPDLHTRIDGLLLSKVVDAAGPDYSLTDPLLVVMTQGGKRLLLGDEVFEYRAGQCLVVAASLPVTGHYLDTGPGRPALAMGLVLRPEALSALLLHMPPRPSARGSADIPALGTGDADPGLLDAVTRLVGLLDAPADAAVLAPLVEQEILWRLLTGPQGAIARQIGVADSTLTHVNTAIRWMRDNYAEPVRIEDLARKSGMSVSAFHRHFRAVTAMSPLQFQKRIRLQQARSLLVTRPGDIAGVGHRVGYDSPSQFNREYRRLFGTPPGQDAARLREHAPERRNYAF
ncbi:AraC family transcriptional regulator [Mycolicibacterium canariasense]|uniref:AraC family transcriptional regulator n=1 Tax=Mycolicibacterium canariasense TaxID=228230 RepID=A0A100WE53_MYCCR|nr:AraC family transcriptional regulator [Mycolicibacterium canariasense]MCV7211663.1 AraC family transcriptional regulator [Mycolicibacterium canariasense]ORV00450.1 AraC family transcriptional regulator [Mycolicibacterium canariasense]GAS96929.1 AraC family transcriptional regulator [Mycolicibacterium canariasense]